MAQLVLPPLAVLWGVGMLIVSLAPPKAESPSERLSQRIFAVSSFTSAIVLLAAELVDNGNSYRHPSWMLLGGLVLACLGALLLFLRARRAHEAEPAKEQSSLSGLAVRGRFWLSLALLLAGDIALVAGLAGIGPSGLQAILGVVGALLLLGATVAFYRILGH